MRQLVVICPNCSLANSADCDTSKLYRISFVCVCGMWIRIETQFDSKGTTEAFRAFREIYDSNR